MAQARYTIRDFERQFPDDAACLEWLRGYLWPNGMPCKTCQRVTKHHRVASRPSYSCDHCGHHVHPMAGTIYHKSSTPLRLWFYAIFLMASTRCGISAKQIERELGVTYKTAWRMFHQIRKMMREDSGPLSGTVEVDEAYIGGRRQNPRGSGRKSKPGRPGPESHKVPVIGLAERQGRVIARVIPNVRAATVIPLVTQAVPSKETRIYTDELPLYERLYWLGYPHDRIKHKSGKYVRGDVHTNTVEGFWSLVKSGLRGVHHRIGPQPHYVQRYLDEYVFRYNRRHAHEPMFLSLLGRVEKIPG
jgi:transposase-like protein